MAKFECGRKRVLDEVSADLAVVQALTEAADRIVRVGEDRSISFLDDELIEKAKAAGAGIKVSFTAVATGYRQSGCDAFEIDRGGVAGRAGLMVVDEASGLVLVTQKPVRDLERHIGEMRFPGHLPPLAKRQQQPRNLSEVPFIAKAMTIVLKTPEQSLFVDLCHVLLARDGKREQDLAGK